MSWKPMDTAPKDGTVIIVYADWKASIKAKPKAPPIAVHAFYQKTEGRWSALDCDKPVPFMDDILNLKDTEILLGWIEVPDSTPLAGTAAYRDGELAREPGKLHLHKSSP